MIITCLGVSGGFGLWTYLRQKFNLTEGFPAWAVFLASLLAGLGVGSWLDSATWVAIYNGFMHIGPAFRY